MIVGVSGYEFTKAESTSLDSHSLLLDRSLNRLMPTRWLFEFQQLERIEQREPQNEQQQSECSTQCPKATSELGVCEGQACGDSE